MKKLKLKKKTITLLQTEIDLHGGIDDTTITKPPGTRRCITTDLSKPTRCGGPSADICPTQADGDCKTNVTDCLRTQFPRCGKVTETYKDRNCSCTPYC